MLPPAAAEAVGTMDGGRVLVSVNAYVTAFVEFVRHGKVRRERSLIFPPPTKRPLAEIRRKHSDNGIVGGSRVD